MKLISLTVSVVLCLLVLSVSQAANILIEYDAAASSPLPPDAVSPSWEWTSNTPEEFWMSNNGTYLLQDWTSDDPVTTYEYFVSPSAPSGSMTLGESQYGVEFRVRPLTDMPLLGYSHFANLVVRWCDDRYSYSFHFDLDADDDGPGTTGALRTRGNSQTAVIAGIDWSVPHTFYVGYYGLANPQGEFDIYVDGVWQARYDVGDIAADWYEPYQDKVSFGDSTSGQPEPNSIDVAAEWYFVRVYDSAFPSGVCGDPNTHPYPDGDLNRDCVIDEDDIAILAENWLIDNQPE